MKKLKLLRSAAIGCACMTGSAIWAHAQVASSTWQLKTDLEARSGAQYDTWRASQSQVMVRPHKLLSLSEGEWKTSALIRLGFSLPDAEAEKNFEKKLASQPGVFSVDADYLSGTVELVYKREDEHRLLEKCFDIHR